jgi:SHS2 domain-containing protein
LEELFADAGRALVAAAVEAPDAIEPRESFTLDIRGEDREYLLFDWLKELLYRFESEHFLPARFEVRLRDDGLSATVWGEPFDPARHTLSHEVKAITYHGLTVEPTADGWLAEVIVDI